MSRVSSSTDSEVALEGLKTTVLPATSAGASFQAAMRKGKFHGTIWPTTPSGSRRMMFNVPASSMFAEPSSARMQPAK